MQIKVPAANYTSITNVVSILYNGLMVLLIQVAKTRIPVKQINAYTLTLKNAFQHVLTSANFSHPAITRFGIYIRYEYMYYVCS